MASLDDGEREALTDMMERVKGQLLSMGARRQEARAETRPGAPA
jgi:MarR family transcriptional regulator, transcriptional regulator for hemolysin